ncbi:MAG: hypothetical protein GVY11_01290 [Gammaproteobacteria bacterium]|jgi:hypothetical protein|nr:hypothetical protein [Gammaproteobacteria bacterium]
MSSEKKCITQLFSKFFALYEHLISLFCGYRFFSCHLMSHTLATTKHMAMDQQVSEAEQKRILAGKAIRR